MLFRIFHCCYLDNYNITVLFLTHNCYNNYSCLRVANSHAYGVTLTHLTCYSRTHAIDKFTHAFKKDHTHTHAT